MIDILHQTMYHRNNILTVKLSEKRSKFSIYLRNLSASPSYKTAFYLCLGIANKRKIRITTKLPIWSPNIASIFVNTSPCYSLHQQWEPSPQIIHSHSLRKEWFSQIFTNIFVFPSSGKFLQAKYLLKEQLKGEPIIWYFNWRERLSEAEREDVRMRLSLVGCNKKLQGLLVSPLK